MEADFSGWATKAGLKCSDGRTIMAGAFGHQDKAQVPLVWQHGHNDPENVLGHAILENRDEGVYCYGFFNDSKKAKHTAGLLKHKDINALSIWANQLVERAGRVLHGAIREVSLVIGGANPGALIDNINIRHSDGDSETLDDEAIIYTGETLELKHSSDGGGDGKDDGDGSDTEDGNDDEPDDKTCQDVIDTMSDEQQSVLHYMLGEALKAGASSVEHSGTKGGKGSATTGNNDPKGKEVKHNVFESDNKTDPTKGGAELKHAELMSLFTPDAMKSIVQSAVKGGSLKAAMEEYGLAHGIENIGLLFPEVRLLEQEPSFLSRRMEWVAGVLGGTAKSPFSRVKTIVADITFEEARARGYIKGTMKKEEWFSVSRRITTPATVYKKQKLDRDDIIDITDFNVVTWLQGEMRMMLNEELARAILIGDGRAVDDPDKIADGSTGGAGIRPILTDDDFFSVKVNVDLTTGGTSPEAFVEAVLTNMRYYKGTGNPTLYTTLPWLSQLLLIKDTLGRRIYPTKADLLAGFGGGVADIVAVEAMETHPEVIGVLVNLVDYNVGADAGGEINMFDFFDIDFNQYKYLIETRLSGALTKPRSAMVFNSAATTGNTAVTATGPTYDSATFTVTVPADANVEYVNTDTGATVAAGDVVLAAGETLTLRAEATGAHYLSNVKTEWSFLRPTS